MSMSKVMRPSFPNTILTKMNASPNESPISLRMYGSSRVFSIMTPIPRDDLTTCTMEIIATFKGTMKVHDTWLS